MKKSTLVSLASVVATVGLVASGCGSSTPAHKQQPSSALSFPPGTDFIMRSGLPKGLDENQIPLIKGTVLGGMTGAFAPSGTFAKGWTVRVQATVAPDAALKSAVALLESKGYTANPNALPGEATLSNGKYTVSVKVGTADPKAPTVAIYTVTEK